MFACACADVPGIARSTVAFGVMMPIMLLLLVGAILTAVFVMAWGVDRLLRPRPHGRGSNSDAAPGDSPGHSFDAEPERGGLDAFTWTEEEPWERR
ncbi:hypothetical protein IM697_27105 [Streptomyces ferrugineus]|uniref:Uncharacterized protein n=1 Tax=Streptomyces ferrugineus TaxID=1413221 RepID=A0A7M2SBW6_9ACTN|nr:hypothetical protein [Streptomyces ferrugineus]QOV33850.1 hypothetical protein IM697_27105 [Streptomyces ferrugineus]